MGPRPEETMTALLWALAQDCSCYQWSSVGGIGPVVIAVLNGVVAMLAPVSSPASKLRPATGRLWLGVGSSRAPSKGCKEARYESTVPPWSHCWLVSMVHEGIAIQALLAQIPPASVEVTVFPRWHGRAPTSAHQGLILR